MQKFRVYLKPKIRTSEFACYGANFMALVYANLNDLVTAAEEQACAVAGVLCADTCSYPMLFSKHVSFHVGLTSPAW